MTENPLKPEPRDEAGAMLTPMIDVVFQLIVFFMLTLRFKTVDQRIQSELPRELGVRPSAEIVDPEPRVELSLGRPPREDGVAQPTVVRLGRAVRLRLPVEDGPDRDAAFTTLERVCRRTRVALGDIDKGAVQARGPEGARVPHGDVVRVIDTLIEAGVQDIAFEGRPPPLPLPGAGGEIHAR